MFCIFTRKPILSTVFKTKLTEILTNLYLSINQCVTSIIFIAIVSLLKMISKIQLIGNKEVTLFVKLNR